MNHRLTPAQVDTIVNCARALAAHKAELESAFQTATANLLAGLEADGRRHLILPGPPARFPAITEAELLAGYAPKVVLERDAG